MGGGGGVGGSHCVKIGVKMSKCKKCQKCQMFVYSGHVLSYTKLVHRHATQTEGNKYFQ